ncbi:MAG: Spo0B domain-containing protein [Alicyclobacillus sp.]|nr:Spo0B domain-containing protein [Alicyclobacillus sp.]
MNDELPWMAVRAHRHDLLNDLQVVKAYLQMQRTDRAAAAIDRLAARLNGLSHLQATLSPDEHELMWWAMQCSRVTLQDWPRGVCVAPGMAAQVGQVLILLDSKAAESGIPLVHLRVRSVAAGVELTVTSPGREELADWWNTVGEAVSWQPALGATVQAEGAALWIQPLATVHGGEEASECSSIKQKST